MLLSAFIAAVYNNYTNNHKEDLSLSLSLSLSLTHTHTHTHTHTDVGGV
jgi:hypothetical protein